MGEYGFRQTLKSNRKLEDVANKIKNASYKGQALSPFEKYMLAYEYVTNFVYNEGGDIYHNETSPLMNPNGAYVVNGHYTAEVQPAIAEIMEREISIVMRDNSSGFVSICTTPTVWEPSE